jgi:hypothetical protein
VLDAFIKKGVRKIVLSQPDEHAHAHNEDAITSLVFSPIRYMETNDAMRTFKIFLLEEEFGVLYAARRVVSVSLDLWPRSFRATSSNGGAITRAEPDLLLKLSFSDGTNAAVVGEMKWEWELPLSEIQSQINREVSAVQAALPGFEVFSFGIVTSWRNDFAHLNSKIITWTEFHRRLQAATVTNKPDDPVAHWASDVCKFLTKANLTVFNGFRLSYGWTPPSNAEIFYRPTLPVLAPNKEPKRFDGFHVSASTITLQTGTIFRLKRFTPSDQEPSCNGRLFYQG